MPGACHNDLTNSVVGLLGQLTELVRWFLDM
jgi:hypothetical protein